MGGKIKLQGMGNKWRIFSELKEKLIIIHYLPLYEVKLHVISGHSLNSNTAMHKHSKLFENYKSNYRYIFTFLE